MSQTFRSSVQPKKEAWAFLHNPSKGHETLAERADHLKWKDTVAGDVLHFGTTFLEYRLHQNPHNSLAHLVLNNLLSYQLIILIALKKSLTLFISLTPGDCSNLLLTSMAKSFFSFSQNWESRSTSSGPIPPLKK